MSCPEERSTAGPVSYTWVPFGWNFGRKRDPFSAKETSFALRAGMYNLISVLFCLFLFVPLRFLQDEGAKTLCDVVQNTSTSQVKTLSP